MSGLYLLGVIALWLWLTRLMWKGWRRGRGAIDADRRGLWDALSLAAGLAWLGVSFWYGGGRTIYYDAKVRELCAQDGGIKVYETVRLPADKFNQWGQVNFYKPTQGENALGAEYAFRKETYYFRIGNPEVWRTHVQVTRRSDNNLLGESTRYSRRGGDLPGPWHTSSYGCPREAGQEGLIQSIFQTAMGGNKQ